MAYAIAWNEATPVGASTSMSDVDAELQNLKKSVRERMNDVLANVWETDANNPKTLDVQAIAGTQDRARVYRNGALNLASGGAYVETSWDTETYDDGGLWVIGAPTRLTTVTDGWHRITSDIALTTGVSVGVTDIRVLKNGGTSLNQVHFYMPASVTVSVRVSVIDEATAGDYYEIRLRNTSANAYAYVAATTASYAVIERLDG